MDIDNVKHLCLHTLDWPEQITYHRLQSENLFVYRYSSQTFVEFSSTDEEYQIHTGQHWVWKGSRLFHLTHCPGKGSRSHGGTGPPIQRGMSWPRCRVGDGSYAPFAPSAPSAPSAQSAPSAASRLSRYLPSDAFLTSLYHVFSEINNSSL